MNYNTLHFKGNKRKSTKHTQNVCYDTVTKHFETEWSNFSLKINASYAILALHVPSPIQKIGWACVCG